MSTCPRKIHVVYFTSKTLTEHQASGDKKIHSAERMNTFTAGDICLLSDLDKRCFVGFAVLKGTCALSDLLDVEVYGGEDAKYNKYEFPTERYVLFPEPVSYEEVARFCVIPVGDKTPSNIYKGCCRSAEAFYGTKGEPSLVIDRFRALVLSWVATTMM
jgi:hypothetical protein